jgi:hypothetical protein
MFTNNVNHRYYSHARVALFQLLKGLQLKNATILVPEFICRELLAGLNELNTTIHYYSVNERLQPALSPKRWPKANVVIAVNYFGHAQPLDDFRQYCQETGAFLVEDNAHGLFSKDANGELLGTRGDFAIFSLRKTLPLSFGALLRINDRKYVHAEFGEIKSCLRMYIDPRLMKYLLSLLPFWDKFISRMVQNTIRNLRGISGKDKLNTPKSDAEHNLPTRQSYSKLCRYFMKYVSAEKIKILSQDKAILIRIILKSHNVEPLFDSEDTNTIPYGVPFYCHDKSTADLLTQEFESYGLDCVKWPDLPEQIYQRIGSHHFYNNCYWVPFDWWSRNV